MIIKLCVLWRKKASRTILVKFQVFNFTPHQTESYLNPMPFMRYSTRLKDLDNSREAVTAKPFGISTKVFSMICTIWSPTLFKVLEIFRAIHFFSKTFFFQKLFWILSWFEVIHTVLPLRLIKNTYLHNIVFDGHCGPIFEGVMAKKRFFEGCAYLPNYSSKLIEILGEVSFKVTKTLCKIGI